MAERKQSAKAGSVPPRLVPLNDGPQIILDKPITFIGRHLDCDVKLSSSKISRRHCCVVLAGSTTVIRDLGSTNGVRINGRRVVEGRVEPGDELMIGDLRFRLQGRESAREQQRPPQAVASPPKPAADPDALYVSTEMPIAIPEDADAGPPGDFDPEAVKLEPISDPFLRVLRRRSKSRRADQ